MDNLIPDPSLLPDIKYGPKSQFLLVDFNSSSGELRGWSILRPITIGTRFSQLNTKKGELVVSISLTVTKILYAPDSPSPLRQTGYNRKARIQVAGEGLENLDPHLVLA